MPYTRLVARRVFNVAVACRRGRRVAVRLARRDEWRVTQGEGYLVVFGGALYERDWRNVRRQRAEDARVDVDVEGLHLYFC